MKLVRLIIVLIFSICFFNLLNEICLADTCYCPDTNITTNISDCDQGPCRSACTCTKTPGNPIPGNPAGGDPVTLDDPLGLSGQQNTIPTLLGKIINAVLGIVGSLALVMFIYGGFTWMTAAGNSEKVKKGMETLIWAAIGLAVIFTSYAMVKFIFTGLKA